MVGKENPFPAPCDEFGQMGNPAPFPADSLCKTQKSRCAHHAAAPPCFVYFWKVTPDTVTLTPATSRPLVFITAF